MPNWYVYAPLAPLLPKYHDDGTRVLFTADVDWPEGRFAVSAIGELTHVELIRVTVRDSDGNLTPEQGRTVSQLVEHAISILRLTTSHHVERLWLGLDTMSLGSHGDEQGLPNLGVSIRADFLGGSIDIARVANTFAATALDRSTFKLFSDANSPTLPLQYKFLSLYKLLEIDFKRGKKWPGLDGLLDPLRDDFNKLKLPFASVEACMHALRDKCAHIVLGRVGETKGISGLSDEAFDAVDRFMPLFREIVRRHLSTKFKNIDFQAR